MLRFASGASGLIFCSVATATNFEFTVYGAGGLVEISRPDLSRFRFAPIAHAAPSGVVPAPPDEVEEHPGVDMLRAELDAFARAIRDGTLYPVPVEDVLHGMAIFDALVASAPDGAVVAVQAT
jgi:predicted dehydrogenase